MKQQSALEMLVVYSWALLLIGLFVALALVMSGSSRAVDYLPGTCSIQPLIPCIETLVTGRSATSNITFTVEFINQLGITMQFPASDAINLSVNNLGISGTGNFYGACNPQIAGSGARVICTVSIPGTVQPPIGSQTSSTFSISYSLCNSGSSCSTGYVSTGQSVQQLVPGTVKLYYVTIAASPSTGSVELNGIRYYTGTRVLLVPAKYTVFAVPPAGYHFSSWSITSPSTLASTAVQNTTLAVQANATLTATFT